MTTLVANWQAMWAARDRGATAVEYGLMVLLIAIVIFVAVGALGTALSDFFGTVPGQIPTAP